MSLVPLTPVLIQKRSCKHCRFFDEAGYCRQRRCFLQRESSQLADQFQRRRQAYQLQFSMVQKIRRS